MKPVKFSRTPFTCPVCGESLDAKALACPECGACERSGWQRDTYLDGVDLPDDEFDADGFNAKEFGLERKVSFRERVIQVVIVLLLIAFALGLIFQ
jgi:hypothetical protein